MNSTASIQTFAVEPYQQLYVIENNDNPILFQAPNVYTVTEQNPVITEEAQPANDSLKSFYENSVNLVGHLNGNLVSQIHDSEVFINIPNRSPNVEEYLTNTHPQKRLPQNKDSLSTYSNVILDLQRYRGADTVNIVNNNVQKKNFKIAPKIKKLPQQRNNNSANLTSVPILKVGKKYHCVNQLTDEHTRLVKEALQNIGDPERGPLKPTYDEKTNTKIIYKVVYPNDLKVLSKNKIVIDGDTASKPEVKLNESKSKRKPESPVIEPETEKVVTMTRSGRTVKVPKYKDEDEVTRKHKRKNMPVIHCFRCSNEFNSTYKLQRHYEAYPSHIPTTSHTSLFHCLLAIVNNGKVEEKTDIFLQQLELLITSLDSILPCLLKKFEGIEGTFCRISEGVGRLFGMSPGKYNINIDALNCVKGNDGTCEHHAPKTNQLNSNSDLSKPSQVWLSKHIEDTATENEAQICARTNSIETWPPFTKRTWKRKQSSLNPNLDNLAKKSLSNVEHISLGDKSTKDSVTNTLEPSVGSSLQSEQHTLVETPIVTDSVKSNPVSKTNQIEFRSTHFDVRFSPLKNQQSGVFKQFQINLPKFEPQLLQPPTYNQIAEQSNSETTESISDNTLEGMLQELVTSKGAIGDNSLDIIGDLNCKSNECFTSDRSKEWISAEVGTDPSHDGYQESACIQPTMIHIKDPQNTQNNLKIDQVLNVTDSCLPLPPGPLNDCLSFNLDLFSFNNP